jgi:hypothetical protein
MQPRSTLPGSLLLLFSLCLVTTSSTGQRIFERKLPPIVPPNGKMRPSGFYAAPGITYALAPFGERDRSVSFGDSAQYNATYNAAGRIGPYVEAGWFFTTGDPVVLDLWDVGLAYKQLGGRESFTGAYVRNDSVSRLIGDGQFTTRMATAHVNANKFLQTSDRQFVLLALGANVDYRFSETLAHDPEPHGDALRTPDGLRAQLHAKVGYGFKVGQRALLIPTLETPISTAYPWDMEFGRLQWASTLYRPIIFSVRVLFLRYPKGFACTPVRMSNDDKQKHKAYKQEGYHP